MAFEIRPGRPEEKQEILRLFPRLAAFPLPPWRRPEEFWRGDSQDLENWSVGKKKDYHVFVAVAPGKSLLGALTHL